MKIEIMVFTSAKKPRPNCSLTFRYLVSLQAKHVMSPEGYASYLSWLFFSWFNSVIKLGGSKTLNHTDLPEIVPQLRARTVWSQFQMMSNIR